MKSAKKATIQILHRGIEFVTNDAHAHTRVVQTFKQRKNAGIRPRLVERMLEIVRTKVGEDGFELRGIGAFWDRSLDEIVDAVAKKARTSGTLRSGNPCTRSPWFTEAWRSAKVSSNVPSRSNMRVENRIGSIVFVWSLRRGKASFQGARPALIGAPR